MSLNTELENADTVQVLPHSRNKLSGWIRNSSFAVAEQAFIAGSNFLVNVLVARWLMPEQYGAYVIVFATYMLLIGVYQGLILEPMAVLLASFDEYRFRCALGSLLRIQVWVSAAAIVGLLVAVLVITALHGNAYLARTLAALMPSLPAIFVFWLLRGACYLRKSPHFATQAAVVYSAVMLLGLVIARHWNLISGSVVFLDMGVSAIVVSAVLLRRLRPVFRSDISDREQWREHWNFGRWELSKTGFDWICENIAYTFTAGFIGIAQVGALKALNMLFLPQNQIFTALRRLFLPHLAIVAERDGRPATARLVWRMVGGYLIAVLAYGTVLSVLAKPILNLLYAGKFTQFSNLVPWLVVAGLVGLPTQALDMGLRAIRMPKAIFTVSCVSALASICITLPLTWAFGIPGAVSALIVSYAVMLVVISVIFVRNTRVRAPAQNGDAEPSYVPGRISI